MIESLTYFTQSRFTKSRQEIAHIINRPMNSTNFFYLDQNNQKQGPVTEEQLKELVARGVIVPKTPMETDTGQSGLAGQIPGLFDSASASPAQPSIGKQGKESYQQAVPHVSGAYSAVRDTLKSAASEHSAPSGDSQMDYKRNKCYFNPNRIGWLPLIAALLGGLILWDAMVAGYNVIISIPKERANVIVRCEENRSHTIKAFEKNRDDVINKFNKEKDNALKLFEAGSTSAMVTFATKLEKEGDNAIAVLEKERDTTIARYKERSDNTIAGLEREKNTAIVGLERERDNTIAGLERERDNTITYLDGVRVSGMYYFLIGFLIGLVVLATGTVLIIKTVRSKKVTDTEMDQICADYVSKNLKSMALKKLGIDEDQIQAVAPIQFHGYYYKNLSSDRSDSLSVRDLKTLISSTQHQFPVQYKMGKDMRFRASNYKATIFFFSADQVYYYGLAFSLLANERRENTSDNFYGDIVDVTTVSDTVIHRSGLAAIPSLAKLFETMLGSVLFGFVSALLFGTKTETIKFDEFTLTTSGGTTVGATISDMATAERSIQGMKNMVRSKKQEQQDNRHKYK